MKNILIVFVFLSTVTSFAAEPVYKNKPFVPQYDGVVMSLEEINSLKAKVEELEKQEQLVQQYSSLVEDYRKLKDLQQTQIDQFVIIDKLKQESLQIYKEAIKSYKEIISELKDANIKLDAQVKQQKRTSRWQKNMNFVFGFLAPILGAKALDSIR